MLISAIAHWDFYAAFSSRLFWCGLGGWIVASILKIIIVAIKTRNVDFVYLVSPGGMPSSHSAAVTALATGIGYTSGFDTPIFVFSLGFAIVTMYDAATVRKAAGEQAKVLNAIIQDFKTLEMQPGKRLRELLGHTPKEVLCGLLTGIVWATILCHFFN